MSDERDMSVTPLDVGFDLRRHEIAIALPVDVEAVRYVDKAGGVRTARGSFDAIAAELEAAGYLVSRGAS